ncbi:MAG: hypothetical protein WD002_08825 [Pseudomonadales bacterium]
MAAPEIEIQRLVANPIITTDSSPSLGNNVNGPSVIRVPNWVDNPLGKYYMYFAHHRGKHIRLAYADSIGGPWTVYEPGVLHLEESYFPTGVIPLARLPRERRERVAERRADGYDPLYTHIASPEAVIVPEKQEIRLYYHGMLETGSQASRVAVSRNGLKFDARQEVITRPYLRVFPWNGQYYGLAMPGVFYRSSDGLTKFEEGLSLFNPNMRHSGLMIRDSKLYVFWTQAGHAPERILLSTIDINADWSTWQASEPVEILRPETDWEGADRPIEPSRRGAIETRVHQLRDPEVFEEGSDTYLFYSIAGEAGIALAKVIERSR